MALSEDERDAAKLQTAIENDDGYRITLEELMTDLTGVDIRALLERDNDDLRAALEAMLPKPPYPEHMLGLWAQHPTYGRVLVTCDSPDKVGMVSVSWPAWRHIAGAGWWLVPVSELAFPYQVNEGELPTETMYNTLSWGRGGLNIRDKSDGQETAINDKEIAQVAYAMLAYAGEPQPQPVPAPEYVETAEEYEGLPNQHRGA